MPKICEQCGNTIYNEYATICYQCYREEIDGVCGVYDPGEKKVCRNHASAPNRRRRDENII